MNEIAARCRRCFADGHWYEEKTALLYVALLGAQDQALTAEARINAAKSSTRAELARRIRRAQQFMLEAYSNVNLNLNIIAGEACLSPYHLIRVFKAHAGQTPMQYLTAVRMAAALSLLRETSMTVTEVASAVGYGDRAAFFRAFRKHYGRAPSAFVSRRLNPDNENAAHPS